MEVFCVKCGERGGVAADVENGSLYCSECESTYTADDVEAVIAGWTRVLPWLKAHPARETKPGAKIAG